MFPIGITLTIKECHLITYRQTQKGNINETLKISNETFKFLAWLVRQDVTLPSVMVDYLKWNNYSKQEIKSHLLALNNACIEAGKRASCHTICWMAPFMIFGRKIRNAANLPSLQLTSNTEKCINCKVCAKKCPMSLEVNTMVQTGDMENSECILCGSCVDIAQKEPSNTLLAEVTRKSQQISNQIQMKMFASASH